MELKQLMFSFFQNLVMEFIGLLVSFVVLFCFTTIIIRVKKNYGHLESLGIPVIKPVLCFGSPPFAWHKIYWNKWYQDNHKKYGLTFGQYIGVKPYINTIDPEIIQAVYVKDFDVFSDMIDNPHLNDKMKTVDLAQGQDWKNIRKFISPIFSSGKLKSMLEPISEVADKAISHLRKQSRLEDHVATKSFFQGYALDAICKYVFGIDTNAHENPNHQLVRDGKGVAQGFLLNNWLETLVTMMFYFFPRIESVFPALLWPQEFYNFHDITNDMVNARVESQAHYGDFIDKIIFVMKNSDCIVTSDMIKAQGAIFFAAGFETTSSTLTMLCYNLANHPDVQTKLFEEVVDLKTIDYDSINKLLYMEACILESLRLFSPVFLQERVCKRDIELKGMLIRKGTYIRMPIMASHMNPDFFPDPEVFKPERFLKENQDLLLPFTFRAFSGGPRVCLGQRFAMMEMKILLTKILKHFKIEKCPKTEIVYNKGDLFFANYQEVYLRFVKR